MRAVLRIVWLSATLASAYMPLATPRSGIAPLLRAPIPQPASRVPRLVASAAEPPRPSNREADAPRRTTPPVASAAGEPQNSGTSFELYDERWLQLGYLSLLALLSDWVCFSVAAAPETWEATYAHDPATLIDIFLFTNVFFCLVEPVLVRRFGLRSVVVGAAGLMCAGCALRSGVPFSGAIPPYSQEVAGTLLVGAAQPFFQCTPPLLSADWFGADERALSTAVAINFNQVGIATAFLVGGAMAQSQAGLGQYFDVITLASFVVAIGALLQFKERPPMPPSGSAAVKAEAAKAPQEKNVVTLFRQYIDEAGSLLQTPGFVPPLVAFVTSIGVSNVVSAFFDETLIQEGITDVAEIDLSGAGFQAAIVLGGILIGGYVDRTKRFKGVTQACLAATLFLLLVPLSPASGVPPAIVLPSLLALGALVGPVQPINAELAVEVSYPADENTIEAMQQLCGNLFSALLVPVAERAATLNFALPAIGGTTVALQGDSLLLGAITFAALLYFSTFDAPLKRAALDCATEDDVSGCEVVTGDLPCADDEITLGLVNEVTPEAEVKAS